MENKIERNQNVTSWIKYFSQYVDIKEKYDSLTGCGATCAYAIFCSLIPNFEKQYNINDFIKEGKENNGYITSKGWLHQYFVDFAKKTT